MELRHFGTRRPAQSGMVVQERRRAEHRPLECPIARHRSLPKRSQAACIRCIVDVAPRDEGRTRRDRHPTIRSLLRNSSVLYNGRLMRSPRGDGGPLRGFGRAEMNRENAERLVTELFTSSYSATVRYAAYKCGSLDLAEDVVQDAFGALYARLREGASIRQPRAWVLQTVRNKIYKAWHRTERRPERAISRLDLEGLPLPADSFGGSADSARPHLRQFLAGLSPREREVILLRAQGLRYREIASQLGISSNSVGTLLLRAMRKMRAARTESILRSVEKVSPSS